MSLNLVCIEQFIEGSVIGGDTGEGGMVGMPLQSWKGENVEHTEHGQSVEVNTYHTPDTAACVCCVVFVYAH